MKFEQIEEWMICYIVWRFQIREQSSLIFKCSIQQCLRNKGCCDAMWQQCHNLHPRPPSPISKWLTWNWVFSHSLLPQPSMVEVQQTTWDAFLVAMATSQGKWNKLNKKKMQVVYIALYLPDWFHMASTHFTEQSVLITGFESLPGLPEVKGFIAAYIWRNPNLNNSHPHSICNFCTLSSWSDLNTDKYSKLKDS